MISELAECKKRGDIEFVGVLFLAAIIDAKVREEATIRRFMEMKASVLEEGLARAKREEEKALFDLARGTQYSQTHQDQLRRVYEAEADVRDYEERIWRKQQGGGGFDLETDYYVKILADTAVEPIFGVVFRRLLRAIKAQG